MRSTKLIWKDSENPEDIRQKMLKLVGKNVVAKKGASKTGYFTIFSVGEIHESRISGIGSGFLKFLEGNKEYTESDGGYNFKGLSGYPVWACDVVYGIEEKNGCTISQTYKFHITKETNDYFEDIKECSFVYYGNHPFLFYESEIL